MTVRYSTKEFFGDRTDLIVTVFKLIYTCVNRTIQPCPPPKIRSNLLCDNF